ncbi:hypothetical protein [Nocardioides sp. B-3]|uniref:hypothetical protein n=1 Tax=Nocardioides sp. B-3 TaxID=2895565 RepID=UPI00300E2F42
MNAREEILEKIRTALRDIPVDGPVGGEVPAWTYGEPVSTGDPDVVERFAERVADYRAVVVRVPLDRVAAAVAEQLAEAGAVTFRPTPGSRRPGWLPRSRRGSGWCRTTT